MVSERLRKLQAEIERTCFIGSSIEISNGNYVSNYIDLYRLTCQTTWLNLITSELRSRIFELGWDPKYVAGKELHGALLASHMNSNTVIIRKESNKVYDSRGYLGPKNIMVDSDIVLIDDVTSAGINMEDSIRTLSLDFNIVGAISVVCRGSGAFEVSRKWDIPFEHLIYLPEDIV